MLHHRIELDPYADGRSALHRWDPRAKIAAAVLLGGATAALHTVRGVAVALALMLAALAASRLPAGFVLRHLSRMSRYLLPFLVVFPLMCQGDPLVRLGPVTIYEEGLALGFVVWGKALALFVLGLVVLNTARLGDTFWALERLGVPRALRELGMMTLRYLPTISEELNSIKSAAAARGFRFAATGRACGVAARMAGSVIGRSLLRADRVWNAMRCRGFDGRFHTLRTWRMRAADVAALAAGSAAALALLLVDRAAV